MPTGRWIDERSQALAQLERWLERPMIALGFVWFILLVLDLFGRTNVLMDALSLIIWIIFVLDFTLRFTLAPAKSAYLRGNWLMLVSLAVPALRVVRVAQAGRMVAATRAARGPAFARVVTSLNRGMRALKAGMARRGLGYILTLTLIVIFAGAGGIYAFESRVPGAGGIHDFSTAVWWTAMIVTTMGSEYWPKTAQGRILCLMLAIYAFMVFAYVTALLASYFVGRGAKDGNAEVAGESSIRALQSEIQALRKEMETMRKALSER